MPKSAKFIDGIQFKEHGRIVVYLKERQFVKFKKIVTKLGQKDTELGRRIITEYLSEYDRNVLELAKKHAQETVFVRIKYKPTNPNQLTLF